MTSTYIGLWVDLYWSSREPI